MKGLETKDLSEPVPELYQRRFGRSRFVFLLATLGVLAWINGYFREAPDPTVYALCSPRGTANVYTVDANDTRAQCLVVKGERFLYTGTYGEYPERTRLLEKPTQALS